MSDYRWYYNGCQVTPQPRPADPEEPWFKFRVHTSIGEFDVETARDAISIIDAFHNKQNICHLSLP